MIAEGPDSNTGRGNGAFDHSCYFHLPWIQFPLVSTVIAKMFIHDIISCIPYISISIFATEFSSASVMHA